MTWGYIKVGYKNEVCQDTVPSSQSWRGEGMEVSVASNLTLLLQKKSEINKLNLSAYISKILFMLKIKSKSKVNCLLLILVLLQ